MQPGRNHTRPSPGILARAGRALRLGGRDCRNQRFALRAVLTSESAPGLGRVTDSGGPADPSRTPASPPRRRGGAREQLAAARGAATAARARGRARWRARYGVREVPSASDSSAAQQRSPLSPHSPLALSTLPIYPSPSHPPTPAIHTHTHPFLSETLARTLTPLPLSQSAVLPRASYAKAAAARRRPARRVPGPFRSESEQRCSLSSDPEGRTLTGKPRPRATGAYCR